MESFEPGVRPMYGHIYQCMKAGCRAVFEFRSLDFMRKCPHYGTRLAYEEGVAYPDAAGYEGDPVEVAMAVTVLLTTRGMGFMLTSHGAACAR